MVILLITAVFFSTVSIIIGAIGQTKCDIKDASTHISVSLYMIIIGTVTLLGEIIYAIELIHKKWPQEWLISIVYYSKWFTLFIEFFRFSWHIVGGIALWNTHNQLSGSKNCSFVNAAFIIWVLCIYHITTKIIDLSNKFKKNQQSIEPDPVFNRISVPLPNLSGLEIQSPMIRVSEVE